MSLFVVNRYQGTEDAPVNSEDHLATLLKQIQERKKRRSTASSKEVENEEIRCPVSKVPRKKRKKHKPVPVLDNADITSKSKVVTESEHGKESKDPSVPQDDVISSNSQESAKKPENLEHKTAAAKSKQDFLILGSDSHKKKPVVKRVLPDWLVKPELISADVNSGPPLSEFETIVDDKLLEILRKTGSTKLFPVQAKTIPWILECDKHRKAGWWPQDVCVSAPTGSGKTLAYVLPIVQQLQYRLVRKVRCLVVLPVQELAAQVFKIMKDYAAHTKLRVALLSSKATFQQEQINLVKKTDSGKYVSKVDIIVTTPGRLIDHIQKTTGFSLASLRFLVIDEADKTTDWLEHLPAPHSSPATLNISNIKSGVNRPAQKLLFSATLSQDPEKLSRLGLFQPKLFTSVLPEDKDGDLNLDADTGNFVGRYTSPDELVEKAIECELLYKPIALFKLITEGDKPPSRTLVFANSAESVHNLTKLIRTIGQKKGLTVAELSAKSTFKMRGIVLSKFSQGDIQVLISTDALARGMDIPGVTLVVSYDMPKHIKGYIHRSGRTGRAGNPGTAVSILTRQQVVPFTKMLSAAKKTVPEIEKQDLEAFSEAVHYKEHLSKVAEAVNKEKIDSINSLKDRKRKHRKEDKR